MGDINLGQIGIIGNGSWGTALTKILTDNGRQVYWWVRNSEAKHHLETRHHNPHYLTSVRFLPHTIKPTNNLGQLLDACDTVLITVPSAYVQQVMETVEPNVWHNKNIISAIKGVLPDCSLLLNDYLAQSPDFDLQRYIAITGPCHAEEVAQERLSYLTFSGLNDALTATIAQTFHNDYIFTSHNHDIWGAQLAAVLKNIYAIGAGIAHGLDYGDNFLSVYITNCYREMYRFLNLHFEKIHPSNEHPDFHTSAYLGDLLVTCYSLHSRNRMFGTMLGKGYSVKSAILEMNMVAEGYYASRGIRTICAGMDIELPIAKAIYDILWQEHPPTQVLKEMEKTLS